MSLKILQILPELCSGGVERGTIDLALFLKEKGHHPIVMSNGGPLVNDLEQNKIEHISWPVHRKNPFTILWYGLKLARFVRTHKIDLIHARSRVPAWITFLAAKMTHIKWITTCHGLYNPHFFSRVMCWSDKIIVATDAVSDHCTQKLNADPKKIQKIPRGVDLDEFKFNPKQLNNPPTISVIGRISPIKGHKDFLQALAKLKQQGFKFRAQIVGSGKPQFVNELQSLAMQLDLKREVSFLGHQKNISTILRQIDLVILPTTYPEAFGRVLIEAQAAGVAVIGTNVGGVSEVIQHQKSGLLIKPKCPEELAQTILEVFNHPEKTNTRIVQARKDVERKFSKTYMAQSTLNLYTTHLQPKKILIFKLSSLGDIILISPSLKNIREAYPKANITVLTDPKFIPVWENCPWIDDIQFASKKYLKWTWPYDAWKLRQQNFDLSFDFQNTFWTHSLAFLASISKSVGYERKAGKYLLTLSAIHKNLKPVEHQFEVLKLLNIPIKHHDLNFWISNQDETQAQGLLKTLGILPSQLFTAINIGSSWDTKRWKANYIAEVYHKLTEKNHAVILTGDKDDLNFEKEICTYLNTKPLSLVGKTSIPELAAILKMSAQLISADSSPLHLAAAFKIPSLALFGPTEASRHIPPSDTLTVLSEQVDCGPCYKTTCAHHSCMSQLRPARVLSEINL